MSNGTIPVVMLPLAEAKAHGMEITETLQPLPFKLSHGDNIKWNPLDYIKFATELHHEEEDWFEAVLGNRTIRVLCSPLKKYRGKQFNARNFRRIITKHAVAPCLLGGKVYLLGWNYLQKLFGMANLINYLWEFHEINFYFDRGFIDGVIEPLERQDDSQRRAVTELLASMTGSENQQGG